MELKTVFTLKGLFLCLFLLSFLSSCKKDEKEDDECVPPALSTQLKGVWHADITALSASLGKVDLTFTEDGEVKGNLSEYLAMMPGVGTIDDLIKYKTTGDTIVEINATSDGTAIPTFSLGVQERTCDKIVLVTTGVTITLTK